MTNATFYVFKPSGKWYTTERGILSEECFRPYLHHGSETPARVNTWNRILVDNHGHMPGLSTTGASFDILVVPDPDVEFGWPLLLRALEVEV